MRIQAANKDVLTLPSDLIIAVVFQGIMKRDALLQRLEKAWEIPLIATLDAEGFEGKLGQTFLSTLFVKGKSQKVVLVGAGEKKQIDLDGLRKMGGQAVKLAEKQRAKDVVMNFVGSDLRDTSLDDAAQAFVEGAWLAHYRFHVFHGTKIQKEKEAHPTVEIDRLTLVAMDMRQAKKMEEGIERAKVFVDATRYARDLVNTPSSHMTPSHLAEEARKLANHGIGVKIMSAQEMEKMGMHAALAVGQGSTHQPLGVHLIYRPRLTKKRVVLVGKAVTFDSGGLSLKPADGMMTMKIDMAGAATVLGVFRAIAKLKLPIELHGIFLAVENMPSGTAYRPGDVVTAMNGMTIEILNTDAEGRVTLADALTYAVKQEPDAIIDLATLTGACVVALGEDVAGLFSNDQRLVDRLMKASKTEGEPLWQLPLYEPYQDLIKSKIADLKNIGNRSAGAITAALFLKPFVGEIPWAHLDIAGPSYNEHETRPDQPYGASGFGVRTLLRYLEELV